VIEPEKDAYGAEADTSHLADYLELLALADRPLRRAELADYLADLKWTVRSRELYHQGVPVGGGEPDEDELDGGTGVSPATEAADRVFEVLADRAELLGDLYPFEVSGSELTRRAPDARHDVYIALLAITVAHHYEVATDEAPERVFEDVVAQVMSSRGLLTVDMAAAGRGSGDFRDAVRNAADGIGLVSAPDAAPSRTHANEEGVDTVSHLSWSDKRPGHWIFIGQATCGQSGTWQRKIQEPWPDQWQPMLGSSVTPWAYLAVPHHVETPQMSHLSVGTGRLVLDRLRLCRHVEQLTSSQRQVIDAVLADGVYHPGYG
jgi:hypothetical protein